MSIENEIVNSEIFPARSQAVILNVYCPSVEISVPLT